MLIVVPSTCALGTSAMVREALPHAGTEPPSGDVVRPGHLEHAGPVHGDCCKLSLEQSSPVKPGSHRQREGVPVGSHWPASEQHPGHFKRPAAHAPAAAEETQ